MANSAGFDMELGMAAKPSRLRVMRAAMRRWLTPKIIVGGFVVLALVLVGSLAAFIAPYDPGAQDLAISLRPPDWLSGPHMLGTDAIGRDVLSRLIHGTTISLQIAAAVAIVSGIVGIGLGAISGYFGGKVDFAIQKVVEVMWAFPPLLLAIVIMGYFGQGLDNLIFALVIQRWIPFCRVARAQAIALRNRDFVDAARSLGASDTRIVVRHVIPNLLQSQLVIGTFAMAAAIISEAALSFLGLGVPPHIPTWGGMLAEGRTYISTAWWLALFPGLCIFATVLGINLIGDGLRDLFDPRLKRTDG